MQQLYPGAHIIQGEVGTRWLNQYILAGDKVLLMDTGIKGSTESAVYPYMKSIGLTKDIDYIFISHADVDHFGDNAKVKKDYPKALFICHTLDKELIEDTDIILEKRYGWYDKYDLAYPLETKQWLRDVTDAHIKMDIMVTGDEWIQLSSKWSVQVLHLPGHTSGHLGIWDPTHQAAFISDAAMGGGLYNRKRQVISPPPYFNVHSYRSTIHKLIHLQPDQLYTGHYLPIKGGQVTQFLRDSLRFLEQMEEVIMTILNENEPLSLSNITKKTLEKTGPFTEMANELAGPVLAHLKDLMSQHKVVLVYQQENPLWTTL